jgi:hypothetical protein
MTRWALVVLASAASCTTTLRASTTQPNPLALPDPTVRRSQTLHIDVGDVDVPYLPYAYGIAGDRPDKLRPTRLRQSAYFAVVSKDRLRFHVVVVHKWKEIADPTTWHARLEDDRGRVFYPESKELRYDDLITKVWDREIRIPIRNGYGDQITTVTDGGHIRGADGRMHTVRTETQPLDSVDVFMGGGDYVFHAPDLFHQGTRRVTLRMSNAGVEYDFTWNLVDLRVEEEEARDHVATPR